MGVKLSQTKAERNAEINKAINCLIPFIAGTQTAVTGSWTGTTSEISELKDGQTIRYWLPYSGSGDATLTLTLSDGNTVGPINCYRTGTSRLSTHYPAGNVIVLTYREDVTIAGSSKTYTGWWAEADYNNSNATQVQFSSAIKCGTTAIASGNIIVGKDGLYSHLKLGNAFDITYPILWANSAIAASSTSTSVYINIGLNVTTTQSITLTAYKPVFIKGNLSGTTFTPISTTPLTQDIPTSADAYEYILLGVAYSSTSMRLISNHPIFAYRGGAFGQISGKEITDLSVSGKTITYTRGDGSTGTITTQDTTYSAGTGLSLSGTTFNHSNSVTAGTAQGDASKTLTFGGTFTVPTVTYDAQGHVTGKGTTTMTMPANPNTDTKVTQTLTNSSASYPLLLAPAAQTTTTTTTACFASGVTLQPSTKTIAANISGNAGTATKLATARTIRTNLASTSTASFDGSANITPGVTGTLPVANGGTGQTSANAAANAFINSLTTGSAAPQDDDYFISQNVGGGTTTTTYHRRPFSALWSYIKSKADSLYSLIGHTHDAATTSSSGFLSSTDKSKLDGIAAGAQVNQMAFSQVTVGTTEIKADTATDILTLVAGDNVTLTPDATNDKITIAAKDTTYTSLPNPKGLRVQVNGDGASEVRYDGSEAKLINFAAGDNVTLTQDTANNKVTIAAKDTDTKNTAGSTDTSSKIFLIGATSQAANPQTYSHDTAYVGDDGCLYSDGTKVSVVGHTHTKSQITDFPTSLKNPNALTVKADGTSLYTYDGSAAKSINIKAGTNVTISSDSSGNIIINSSSDSSGDAGVIVYQATSGGLYCDGKTTKSDANSCEIQDNNPNGYYKRFRFYCQGYYGLVCVDMPLDRQHTAYGASDGTRYGGVIFPSAENGNINSTGVGPSNHMYYELKWKVTKDSGYWTVQVVDSGWLGLNAGKTSDTDYKNNTSTADAGTGYVSWNQRHNNAYCIYKIVAYTN